MENTDYFSRLENDTEFGTYRVPSLGRYRTRITDLEQAGIPRDIIATEAQRDWHTRGQNGCNFARIAARKALELGWKSHYIGRDLDDVNDVMRNSEDDADCEIMSLVFEPMPASELANTIVTLTEESDFYLEKDELIDDGERRQLFLHYPLQLGRIAAWSMCFAPYDFMPNTRRSPYIEIATRMKEKPDGLHEMLNRKEDEAHLADLIIDKDPKHTGHRITTTIKRTETILGGKPNHITAAKSTITFPVSEL